MVELDVACDACGSAEDDEHMLLCDACDTGFHMFCLQPKVTDVPEGDWFCPHCLEEYPVRSISSLPLCLPASVFCLLPGI